MAGSPGFRAVATQSLRIKLLTCVLTVPGPRRAARRSEGLSRRNAAAGREAAAVVGVVSSGYMTATTIGLPDGVIEKVSVKAALLSMVVLARQLFEVLADVG